MRDIDRKRNRGLSSKEKRPITANERVTARLKWAPEMWPRAQPSKNKRKNTQEFRTHFSKVSSHDRSTYEYEWSYQLKDLQAQTDTKTAQRR